MIEFGLGCFSLFITINTFTTIQYLLNNIYRFPYAPGY